MVKNSNFDEVNGAIKVIPTLKYRNFSNQPYKILSVGDSKIWKTDKEIDINKIHFGIKYPFTQYQHLINERKNVFQSILITQVHVFNIESTQVTSAKTLSLTTQERTKN